MASKKIFCYVDETGQDTKGRLFVVSVVVTGENREALRRILEGIEKTSGKGRRKWTHTRPPARARYIEDVLRYTVSRLHLTYDIYPNTTRYPTKTVLTVARTVVLVGGDACKATVFVDGLRRSEYRWFGIELRHLGIKTDKVRGIRSDEADALMRLADGTCGFVRAAIEGEAPFTELLAVARETGLILALGT